MNSNQSQHEFIEQIVREVLSRLRSHASLVVTPTETPGAPMSTTCVSIADRVITWSQIEHKVKGATKVQVKSNAIITPLVRDELRDRSIAIVVGEQSPAAKLCNIAVAELNPNNEIDKFVNDGRVNRFSSIEQWSNSVGDTIASPGSKAVLLTSKPTLATCLANRNPSVRAMEGRCVESLREGMNEINANVVVINPQDKSNGAIQNIIDEIGP